MDPLGDYLKQARKKKGLSLEQLASRTKIQEHHLIALESEDFANLPAKVFAKGFVRSYAKALGLEEEEALQRFLDTSRTFYDQSHPEDAQQTHVQVTLEAPPRQGVNWSLVFGGLLLIVALAIWYGFPKKQDTEIVLIEPEETSIPTTPIEEAIVPIVDSDEDSHENPQENVEPLQPVETDSTRATLPAVESVPTEVALPAPEAISMQPIAISPETPITQSAPPEPAEASPQFNPPSPPIPSTSPTTSEEVSTVFRTQTLEIEATELTWVVVKSDEEDPSEALLQPGQRVTWKADTQFLLTLGNAAGVIIQLNGQPQGPFGKPGQVVREIRLRP